MRHRLPTMVLLALVVGPAQAEPLQLRYQWKKGQVLKYRAEQFTQVTSLVEEERTSTSNQLNLLKHWTVTEVDAQGVATLQLSLQAIRLETTTPDGEKLLFDSAKPEVSDPHMKEALSAVLKAPIATLRIDGQGRVLEVKESKHGPASRYENELPFPCILPATGIRVGSTWKRPYKITLDPPHGTGEKYPAEQTYACKSIEGGKATIALETTIKEWPAAVLDQIPLIQYQPKGEVVFDVANGRFQEVRLTAQKELQGHQGKDSRYSFRSVYRETWVEK